MRLAPILAALPEERLLRISQEHIRTDERLSQAQLCNHLESAIKSSRFLADFIINRSPPTFSLLSMLLESPDFSMSASELKARALAETEKVCAQLDAGEILGRDDTLRMYRRLLYEARRTDADINTSEAAILAVYRSEQDISLVSHFLVEHHSDLREFWKREGAYEHELGALLTAGVLFDKEDRILLPEDLVAGVANALGLDMTAEATKRLLEQVSSAEMLQILEKAGARTSGSKAERATRILDEHIQAREILEQVGIGELRDICKSTGVASSGLKEVLIERIVRHFATGSDLVVEEEPPPPLKEPRRLDEQQFGLLFGTLKNQELVDILRRRDGLRQSGSKDQRIATLWAAHISEVNLLSDLMNRDLEDVLNRIGLKLAGSKPERIERLINHFGGQASPEGGAVPTTLQQPVISDAAIALAQKSFRDHASSNQQALQDWLETALDAPDLVRCYATEVSNPTQQLKNKLSQAAAAKNGLLVLTLADADALAKTEQALAERWVTNDEWSKSVACVALAQPPGTPVIEVLIERAHSPVANRLRERVFPAARSVFVGRPAITCGACATELPSGARFCPSCGTPVAAQASAANVSPGE